MPEVEEKTEAEKRLEALRRDAKKRGVNVPDEMSAKDIKALLARRDARHGKGK